MEPVFVALDLETTGLNAERDDIIEIAAVRFTPGRVLAEYDTLVRADVEIPLRVTQLTGLAAVDLEAAPGLRQVADAVEAFVGEATVVGHSVGHDLRFLRRHGLLLNNDSLDTFELAGILLPEASRYGVAALMDHLSLDGGGAHRALADAHAHRLLFEALLDRAAALDAGTLSAINRLADGTGWAPARVFRAAAKRASAAVPEGVAGGRMLREVRPPLEPTGPRREIPVEELDGMLGPSGRLAQKLAAWEDRPGQREMLRRVAEAFNRGDHILVEAGTGTGKSLAYLLPAAAWAVANQRPVVVATYTTSLQHQLVENDLPLVQELLDADIRSTVLKGRSHYLCRSRLASLAARPSLPAKQLTTVAKILAWARQTPTGDRAEIPLQPSEMAVWRMVSAEDACTPGRCVYARDGDCWVHRARARAEQAHIIVVNHALLISDMLVDNRLLPAYSALIIDEAHHLEDVATDGLGFRVSEAAIAEVLDELAGGPASLLGRAAASATLAGLPSEVSAELRDAAAALQIEARAGEAQSRELFVRLSDFVGDRSDRGADLRLTAAARSSATWFEVETGWDPLRKSLSDLAAGVNRLATAFAAIHDQIPDAGLAADLAAAQRDARDLFRGLDRIVADPKPDDVTWVSRGGRERLALHRAPLYVGDLLARRLFGDKETVVLTSATLRAGDDFELVRDRLGLQDGDAAVVASPFDYAAASLLYIPNDIPEPGEAGYGRAVQGALAELAVAVGGRTLVLFTSHSELRAAYHAIRGPLGERGISVLGQGLDGSRTSLLSGFRDPNVKSMLLGTRSFWEGIDVPGPALSCLVIARLPFEVPTDPVFAARSETFDEPFYDYAVPRAVLRFRQGFGRLIRTVQDRGVVIVLDRRALTKPYGRVFLDALPPIRRRFGPIHAAASTAERFLAGEPIGPDAPVGLPEGPAWYNGPSGLAGDRNRPTDDWRNDRD